MTSSKNYSLKKKQKPKKPTGNIIVGEKKLPSKKSVLFTTLSIVVITFFVFFPVIKHDFIFWDDPEYVLNNPHIKSINLKDLFGTFYFGNYHPLTMLSYSFEYMNWGFNPAAYHFNNLFLHLFNTVLVFHFVYLLTGKTELKTALITSLLFAIHPMHVESVAWVSERKDLLYGLFFILSMIFYLNYLSTENKKFLLFSFLAFLFSLLSKAQATSLPVVLLAIDFLIKRKYSKNMFFEKIPFFALSLIFGIIAIKAQQTQAAINPDYYTGFKSLIWGCHSLILYIYKAILPVSLSGVHPYPVSGLEPIPNYIYISIPLVLLITFGVYKVSAKYREAGFGFIFFIVTIFLVLKFIPVGDALIAERYSYIPYIGLFFIAGKLFNHFTSSQHSKNLPLVLYTLTVIAFTTLAYTTHARTKVWKDTFTFWHDVAEKYPNYWRAYNNMGHSYYEKKEYKKAVYEYTNAINSDKYCPPVPYLWRGIVYLEYLNMTDSAIADFKKVLEFPNKNDQSQIDGRLNLGLAYYRNGDTQNAINYYNEVLQIIPNNAKAYYLRGLAYGAIGNYEAAVKDYSQSINLQPADISAYLNRGALYTDKLSQFDLALSDFNAVLQLSPKHFDASVNIALVYYKKGELDKAINQYNNVLNSFSPNGRVYYLRALAYAAQGNYNNALNDASEAKKLGNNIDEATLKSWQERL
jgi:protein O-mannosyl-transferase